MAQPQSPQIDFGLIANAFKKRFPDMDLPEMGGMREPETPLAANLAQESAEGGMATVTAPQETNQIGGAKSEAEKIVTILGNRLKRLS